MGEAIRFGWDTTRSNLFFLVSIFVVSALINYVPGIVVWLLEDAMPEAVLIALQVAVLMLNIIVTMGLIRIALKFCDNEKPEFADLFACYPLLIKFAIASVIYGIAVAGGFNLLILPGIFLGITYQFFAFSIIDRGSGPIQALKDSSAITAGTKWNLFIFSLLLLAINAIGALTLVGLLVTGPVTLLSLAIVYRTLSSDEEYEYVAESPLGIGMVEHSSGADVLRESLDGSAEVDAIDENGWTALMIAAKSGNAGEVSSLLLRGADTNIETVHGRTALTKAAYYGKAEVVKMLLEYGSDVNWKDNYDVTALMYATWKGHAATVATLLEYGADVTARSKKGKTALTAAQENGHTKIVQMLREAGAAE